MRRPRLLLARTEHLGDVLLTLPATVALRRALPGCRITYLTRRGLAALAARCPAVDATLELPFPPVDRPRPGAWEGVVREVAPRLRGRFDAALLFRPADAETGSLVEAAGIRARLGYLEPPTRPFLTAGVDHRPGAHAVEQAMDLVHLATRELGGDPPTPPWDPPVIVRDQDREEARGVLASAGVPADASPVVVHPGVGWPLKAWPARRWGRVAEAVADTTGARPVVTGTAAEAARVTATVRASGDVAVGLSGRLSLGGLAALLEQARLVVGSDSGPLHLAALLGTPVVGLYGPADPVEAGPRHRDGRHRIVRVPLPCSPCRTMTRPPCGALVDPRCMIDIGVADVLDAVWSLLSTAPAGARPPPRCR